MRCLAPSAIALLLGASGCYAPMAPTYRARDPRPPSAPLEASILSAQGSHLDAPSGDQRAWLVFDRRVDPTTLRAFNFVLVFDDDSRSYPSAVHLAGADQGFDARSIVLEGEFRDDDMQWTLARVQIVGPVYGTDGVGFRGTSIAVEDPGAPRAIAARRLAAEAEASDCAGSGVRVYFSDAVERASNADDVHAHTFRRASNRLDLCAGPSARLKLEAALVMGTGREGNPASTIDIEGAP